MLCRVLSSRPHATTIALALICPLLLAASIKAQTITEQADAGDAIGTAQQLTGIPITLLTGSLSSTSDIDLYRITIDDYASFSASTTAGPGTVEDTRLYLFTTDGIAVYMNDDDPNDPLTNLSFLPPGHILGPQSDGDYLLGVSLYYQTPTDAAVAQLFFEPDDDPDPDNVDYTTINGPTSSLPLYAWTDYVDASPGSYGITLTGVNGTLPLNDFGVAARAGSSGLTIEWSAPGDHQISSFTLESRESDSERFSKIGTVWSESSSLESPFLLGGDQTNENAGGQPMSFSFSGYRPAPGHYVIRVVATRTDGAQLVWGSTEVFVESESSLWVSSVYPNPASTHAAVQLFARDEGRVAIEMFDLTGRRIGEQEGIQMTASSKRNHSIELAGLASGLYLIRITGTHTVETRSVSVVR